jgi:hypothetical protein
MNISDELKLDSRKRKRVSCCPCGKSNKDGKFVPYDGHDSFGYCHSCGETFSPRFSAEKTTVYKFKPKNTGYIPFDEIPFEIFNKYRQVHHGYSENLGNDTWHEDFENCDLLKGLDKILVKDGNLLQSHFKWLLYRYQVTPSGNRKGVVFWQIDTLFRIRNGKVMWYNHETCKRKNGASTIAYQEKSSLKSNYKHSSCFFGEHLLSLCPDAKVGIVESEKTALYMATIYPAMVWLATGGKHGAKWTSRSVFFSLINREVIIFPDLDAYEEWTTKAKILKSGGVDIEVSELLVNATIEFKSQNPKADIMDLGLVEKWHTKQGNQRYEIIQATWKILPPKDMVKFILF